MRHGVQYHSLTTQERFNGRNSILSSISPVSFGIPRNSSNCPQTTRMSRPSLNLRGRSTPFDNHTWSGSLDYSRITISCRVLAPILRCVNPGFATSTTIIRRIRDSSHLVTSSGTRTSGSRFIRVYVVGSIRRGHGMKRIGLIQRSVSETIFSELCLLHVRQRQQRLLVMGISRHQRSQRYRRCSGTSRKSTVVHGDAITNN